MYRHRQWRDAASVAGVDRARPVRHAERRVPSAAARAALVLAPLLQCADAVLGVLPQGLCHSRHQRDLAARRSGVAWMRAAASAQCGDAVLARAGLRTRTHADRDLPLNRRGRSRSKLPLTLRRIGANSCAPPMPCAIDAACPAALSLVKRWIACETLAMRTCASLRPARAPVCWAASCSCHARQSRGMRRHGDVHGDYLFFRQFAHKRGRNVTGGCSAMPSFRRKTTAAAKPRARRAAASKRCAPSPGTRRARPPPRSARLVRKRAEAERADRRGPPLACAAARGDRYPAAGHRLPRRGRPLHPLEQEVRGDLQRHRRSLSPGVKLEDTLRIGVARGEYPEAIGREEEWIAERLNRLYHPGERHEQTLKDGRVILIEERLTGDGGVIGLRVDITELKQREASFRLLFDGNPVPMIVCALDDEQHSRGQRCRGLALRLRSRGVRADERPQPPGVREGSAVGQAAIRATSTLRASGSM